jgi:hypothetical protein
VTLVSLGLASFALAAQPTESLLPATTKGYVSTHDIDEVRTKFNETQLGEMVADPVMKPFIDDLRKQIGAKLEKAGKRLGVKWEDMEGVYAGESALAVIQPDPKDKNSHATVLIVDVTGKRDKADELLAKVDKNQKADKAVRSELKSGGLTVTVYTQPLAAGEKVAEQSFYFIKDDTLVISDHRKTSEEIIGRFGGKATDSLATVEAFKFAMERNIKEAAGVRHHVRWFVEPIGYAEASRAAQGGRKKRGTDLLKVLPAQGFTAVQGLGGYVFFATGSEELLHRTYVYAPAVKRPVGAPPNKDKYDLAMRMLNFPNGGDLEPQAWVMNDVGGYLTLNWKMQDAFKYSETLVDALAGEKGTFDEIWESMERDPHGPKIDIYKELINHLGERATVLTDITVPVHLKSERQMVLIEVTDTKIVAKTLEKAFKADPAAIKRIFKEHTIWEIKQEETLAEGDELMIEGAGFVSEKKKEVKDEEEDEPVLPNMAVTVFEGHLVVSTHMSFVEELISRAKDPKNLATMDDFKRVHTALTNRGMNAANTSIRYFNRTDETFRHTYEMIKIGKLPESESMFARILNGMLSEDEDTVRKPEIDGSKLPDFALVKKYLGPGGTFIQSENEGWYLVGTLLKKQ